MHHLAVNRQEVQLPVMDDSERSAVPKAQTDTLEGQGGIPKFKFGAGCGGGAVLDKECSVVEMTLRCTMKGE